MTAAPTTGAAALLLGLIALPHAAVAQRPLVVTHATLIDGTGAAPRENATIVIEDGWIVAVGDADEIVPPDGAHVLDATGKYVIPGLADMHVHFGTGGLVEGDPERLLRQFLYYGVTTVLNLGATHGRVEDIARLREDGGPMPHVYATGGLITVPGSHPISTIMFPPDGVDPDTYDWTARGVFVVRTPEEMRAVIARLAAADVDGIKIVVESGPPPFGVHPQMSPELIATAVDESARHGLPVFAHASSLDELEAVVERGVRAVVHLVRDPAPPGAELLAAMARKGVGYLPTLSLFLWADDWGESAELLTDPFLGSGVEERVLRSLRESPMATTGPPSEEDRARRRAILAALKAAHDSGVRIVLGTDTANPFVFPGYSVHHELALLVEAGLTPMEALSAATARAAELLDDDTFGTVTPGRRGDLLILGADPLEDIRHTRTLEAVVRGGEVLDRSRLLDGD